MKLTTYDACAIVEGFDGLEHTSDEHLEAWGHLIATGACWNLQGWYGRNAEQLIEMGFISETGEVQWDEIAQRVDDAHDKTMGDK